jgi:hypothetical protein
LDGEDYKIVEIDGKRYLVKPEIESNEYDDWGKSNPILFIESLIITCNYNNLL